MEHESSRRKTRLSREHTQKGILKAERCTFSFIRESRWVFDLNELCDVRYALQTNTLLYFPIIR